MSGPAPARLAAWRALVRLEESRATLDDARASLPELDGLDERDRRLATELITGTVKRRLSLDAVLALASTPPLDRLDPGVLEALRLSAFQLLFLDRVPAHAAVDDGVALVARGGRRTQGYVNAVLRAVARDGRRRLDEVSERRRSALALPALVLPGVGGPAPDRRPGSRGRRRAARGRQRGARALPSRQQAARRRGRRPGGARRGRDHRAKPSPACPKPSSTRERPSSRRRRSPGGSSPPSRGARSSPGSSPPEAWPRRARSIDLCAAPGTKTAQLVAAHPKTPVTAVEVDPARAAALRANLQRLGATATDVVEADATRLPDAFARRLRRRSRRRAVQRTRHARLARRRPLAPSSGRRRPLRRHAAPPARRRRPLRTLRRRAHVRGVHGDSSRDRRRAQGPARRRRLDGRRPWRRVPGCGAPGRRRLPARASAPLG